MPAKKLAAKTKQKTSKCVETAVATNRKPSSETSEPPRVMDARSNKNRRQNDRRQREVPVEAERRVAERRVKVSRRRQIDPTTCERDYSPEELEFMTALDDYKRRSGRMFPTCSEVLEVFKALGYEKRVELPPAPAMPLSTEPTVASVAATEQAV